MEKKEYEQPELNIVELKHEARLLQDSDFNGEFGLAPTTNDRLA